jgi:hypothetical protein
MSNTTQAPEVTHAELVTNVRYGYWFNHMCERLYTRLDFVLNVVQLVGGSAAAFGVMQGNSPLLAASGVGLAVTAAVALLVQPAIKSERHRRAKCEYLALEAKAWGMAYDDLNSALMKARSDSPTGVDALAVPAYNATLNAIGNTSSLMAETWVQRLARALA